MDRPRVEAWSGVEIGSEPLHGIWARLAVHEATTCRIAAQPKAVQANHATPVIPMLSPALVQGGSLAYLAQRSRTTNTGLARAELGAIGHGPHADHLCARLLEHIRAWDTDRTDRIAATATTKKAPQAVNNTDHLITKRHTHLFLSWGH